MKCYCGVLIVLLALGIICQANPVKRENENEVEDNEIEREKRQMKGSTPSDQAEVKFLGAPMLSPVGAAATGALQAVAGTLQTGRQNGLLLQGTYGTVPGLPYGMTGGIGFGGPGGIGGFGGQLSPSAGSTIGSSITSYPSGFEMYPHNMGYGVGPYPNVVAPITPLGNGGPFGPLENGGIASQLIAQPSHLHQQIAPYPPISGFFPQLGYNPSYQNFQG